MADLGEDSRGGGGTAGLINGQESAFATEDRASPERLKRSPLPHAHPLPASQSYSASQARANPGIVH